MKKTTCFLVFWVLFPVLVFAGTSKESLLDSIMNLEEHLRKAQGAQGPLCDPEGLAAAQTCVALAKEEYLEGHYWESEDALAKCWEKSEGIWKRILACGKDQDVDGVPDQKDQCPTDPETYNGYRELDGCPDRLPERAILTEDRIELIEPFRFTRIYNRLHPSTKPLLLSLAEILRENPQIKIAIQVHLDNSLPEEQALAATQVRAQKVKTALELLGISPNRLDAVGKGSLDPIATNDTPLGRRLNRRVDFVIIHEQGVAAHDPPLEQSTMQTDAPPPGPS